ncbi:unnamed protein product [Bemisia tabaci]|uniref:DUF4806 domain-containing protein n=1 Tax=Bemisia tabaci TaxID=7038 RepID=A0A9P0EXR2_BEMTA|nr:unnamed protein product [Bemisia tabaci]
MGRGSCGHPLNPALVTGYLTRNSDGSKMEETKGIFPAVDDVMNRTFQSALLQCCTIIVGELGLNPQSLMEGFTATCAQNHSKVIFKQFLVLLKRLQKTADQNSTSLENLNVKVDRLLPHEDVGTELTDDSLDEYLRRALPIKSMEEFDSLQEDLKSNSLLRNKLCSILVLAVGKEVKDTCQNMLRKLIIDEVAQKFTYKGKLAGKARFADTEISDLLNDSIRSVYPATDDKIKEFVSEWLTQAKFRVQKREKRKKNTEVQPCIELNLGDSVDQANQNSLNFQSVLEQLRVVSEESLRMEPLQ